MSNFEIFDTHFFFGDGRTRKTLYLEISEKTCAKKAYGKNNIKRYKTATLIIDSRADVVQIRRKL